MCSYGFPTCAVQPTSESDHQQAHHRRVEMSIGPLGRHFLEPSENGKQITFLLLWSMSKNIQNGNLKEAQTIQNTILGSREVAPEEVFC